MTEFNITLHETSTDSFTERLGISDERAKYLATSFQEIITKGVESGEITGDSAVILQSLVEKCETQEEVVFISFYVAVQNERAKQSMIKLSKQF